MALFQPLPLHASHPYPFPRLISSSRRLSLATHNPAPSPPSCVSPHRSYALASPLPAAWFAGVVQADAARASLTNRASAMAGGNPHDFFSQSFNEAPTGHMDGSDYGFSQGSSGYGGSGTGFHFGGGGSGGLDLNSQADAFPDFASYQQILEPGSLVLPPIRAGSRSTVPPSRPPPAAGGGRGRSRGGRGGGRGRGRSLTNGAGSGRGMRGFVPPGSSSGQGGVRGHGASMSHSGPPAFNFGVFGGGRRAGASSSQGTNVSEDDGNEEDEEDFGPDGQHMVNPPWLLSVMSLLCYCEICQLLLMILILLCMP